MIRPDWVAEAYSALTQAWISAQDLASFEEANAGLAYYEFGEVLLFRTIVIALSVPNRRTDFRPGFDLYRHLLWTRWTLSLSIGNKTIILLAALVFSREPPSYKR